MAKKIFVKNIFYVEVNNHDLFYVTSEGDFKVREALSHVEKQLEKYHFVKISSSFLINLRHVSCILSDEVIGNNVSLKISRAMKKRLLKEYEEFTGD